MGLIFWCVRRMRAFDREVRYFGTAILPPQILGKLELEGQSLACLIGWRKVKDQGYRPVVHQFYCHLRPEGPGLRENPFGF